MQDFVDSLRVFLKPNISEDNNLVYSINETDLSSCLNKLGIAVQQRERSNFEQYSMYYENLLRHYHQLLFKKERELVSVKDTLKNKLNEIDMEVKCQVADSCFNLLSGIYIYISINITKSLNFVLKRSIAIGLN
jgi:hypothetical protein